MVLFRHAKQGCLCLPMTFGVIRRLRFKLECLSLQVSNLCWWVTRYATLVSYDTLYISTLLDWNRWPGANAIAYYSKVLISQKVLLNLPGLFFRWIKTFLRPGKPYWRGKISMVDLLIKKGCFVKKEKYSFSLKSSQSKLVSSRRSTVLILLLQ
jgi:hypothetical protein